MLGALVKKGLGALKSKIGNNLKQSNLGKGVSAYKSWKQERAAKPAAPAKPAMDFKVDPIDTNLQIPKVSSFGRGDLYKLGR